MAADAQGLMVDTLTRSLAQLRADSLSRDLSPDDKLHSNIYLSWDDAEGRITGTVASEPGMLLRVTAHVDKTPRWWGLNLVLGAAQLAPGSVLGITADISGTKGAQLGAFIRTGRDGEALDTDLAEPLPLGDTRRVVTLLHDVDQGQPLAATGPQDNVWHTLVLRLPVHSFDLVLHDLRVFVIAPEPGLRVAPRTLASFAT